MMNHIHMPVCKQRHGNKNEGENSWVGPWYATDSAPKANLIFAVVEFSGEDDFVLAMANSTVKVLCMNIKK
jgi:hypothetical protein